MGGCRAFMWAESLCGLSFGSSDSGELPRTIQDLVAKVSERWNNLKHLELCIEGLKTGKIMPSSTAPAGKIVSFKLNPEVVSRLDISATKTQVKSVLSKRTYNLVIEVNDTQSELSVDVWASYPSKAPSFSLASETALAGETREESTAENALIVRVS